MASLFAEVAIAHDLRAGIAAAHWPQATTLDQAADYIERYLATGDDAWLNLCDDFFSTAAQSNFGSNSHRWHYLRAWHAQAAHRFTEASTHLEEMGGLGQADVHIPLLQANLARIIGDTQTAQRHCRRVSASHLLLGQFCLAQTRIQKSPEEINLPDLQSLLTTAGERLPRRQRAWAYQVLAQVAEHLDQPELALTAANSAYELDPSMQHRVQLGQLLNRNARYEQALALTLSQLDQVPALSLVRLAALTKLNRSAEAAALRDTLHAAFSHHIAHDQLLHAREMGEFYLDVVPMPQRAARLARYNWSLQREPEDHELLVRTLLIDPAAE